MTEQEIQKKKKEGQKKVPIHEIRVKVVGVGGGAGSIIHDIAADYPRTEFMVADTDQSALSELSRKKRVETFRFGREVTEGMGTGMNTGLGRKAGEEGREEIEEMLAGADLLIFVSCLGGGTGSGAMPVFGEVASGMEAVSLGVFTLPFDFEREKKLKTAKKALGKLRGLLDGMAVIPNQRVFQIVDEKVPIKEALSSINTAMGESLEGLVEMIHSPGLINIDFADVETILREEKPLAYLTRARAGGKGRVKKVLKKLTENPLHPYGLLEAGSILFNIEAPNNLSLSEVAEISGSVSREGGNRNSKVIFGVNLVTGKNELDVTLLAVGCEMEDLFVGTEEKELSSPPSSEKAMESEEVAEEEESAEGEREGVKKKEREEGSPSHNPTEGQGATEGEEEKVKVRKNALQVQKDLEEVEKKLLKKEEKWESPTFLRKENDD